MKASLFFLLALAGFGAVRAQEVNCVEKQKEFARFVKDGKYKEASAALTLLRKKCAAQDETLYTLGIATLQHNLAVAPADAKEAVINDLSKLYDQYDANFPNNKNGNQVQKAMLLYEHDKATPSMTKPKIR